MVQESPSSCPFPTHFPSCPAPACFAGTFGATPVPLSWEQETVQVCPELPATCDSSSSGRCSSTASSPCPSPSGSPALHTLPHASAPPHPPAAPGSTRGPGGDGGSQCHRPWQGQGGSTLGTVAPAHLIPGLPGTYPLAEAGVFRQAAELGRHSAHHLAVALNEEQAQGLQSLLLQAALGHTLQGTQHHVLVI